MDFAAAYTGFVIGAYGLSALVLGGLVIYILAQDRALRAELDRRKGQP
ncbi:MAG: heme exporter protein CcmD [Rhizobiales bacterium]|nr:heme exporter protein CcmD [Hyphomicrobiales bacterium]